MTVKQAFYFLEGVKQYCHWKMLQAVIWKPKDFEMADSREGKEGVAKTRKSFISKSK